MSRPSNIVISAADYHETLHVIGLMKGSYLKDLARSLNLLVGGKKNELFERVLAFVERGIAAQDYVLIACIRILVLKIFMNNPLPRYEALYNAIASGAYRYSTTETTVPRNLVPRGTSAYSSSGNLTNGASSTHGSSYSATTIQRRLDSESSAYKGHILYFRESPFYRLKRLIHGAPQLAPPNSSRGTCSHKFVLNAEESKLMFGDGQQPKASNIECFLLCGISNNRHPSTSSAYVQFPHPIELHINGTMCKENVKGIKNKIGTARPAKITSLIKPAPELNVIEMVYLDTKEPYLLYCYIVETISTDSILQDILANPHLPIESTRAEIQHEYSGQQDDDDDDIMVETLSTSLKCPLTYARMKYPSKSIHCQHIQCFDALSFIQLQEQIPSWACPICSTAIKVKDLAISDYYSDVLSKTDEDTESVSLEPDGSWKLLDPAKDKTEESRKRQQEKTEEKSKKAKIKSPEIEVITLDSESDEDPEPLAGGNEQQESTMTSNEASSGLQQPRTSHAESQPSSNATIDPHSRDHNGNTFNQGRDRVENPIQNRLPSVTDNQNGYHRDPSLESISNTESLVQGRIQPRKVDFDYKNDLLYPIFCILYSKDSGSLGMTSYHIYRELSKIRPISSPELQVCVLIENLLKGYVSFLKRGNFHLTYAISIVPTKAGLTFFYLGMLSDRYYSYIQKDSQFSTQMALWKYFGRPSLNLPEFGMPAPYLHQEASNNYSSHQYGQLQNEQQLLSQVRPTHGETMNPESPDFAMRSFSYGGNTSSPFGLQGGRGDIPPTFANFQPVNPVQRPFTNQEHILFYRQQQQQRQLQEQAIRRQQHGLESRRLSLQIQQLEHDRRSASENYSHTNRQLLVGDQSQINELDSSKTQQVGQPQQQFPHALSSNDERTVNGNAAVGYPMPVQRPPPILQPTNSFRNTIQPEQIEPQNLLPVPPTGQNVPENSNRKNSRQSEVIVIDLSEEENNDERNDEEDTDSEDTYENRPLSDFKNRRANYESSSSDLTPIEDVENANGVPAGHVTDLGALHTAAQVQAGFDNFLSRSTDTDQLQNTATSELNPATSGIMENDPIPDDVALSVAGGIKPVGVDSVRVTSPQKQIERSPTPPPATQEPPPIREDNYQVVPQRGNSDAGVPESNPVESHQVNEETLGRQVTDPRPELEGQFNREVKKQNVDKVGGSSLPFQRNIIPLPTTIESVVVGGGRTSEGSDGVAIGGADHLPVVAGEAGIAEPEAVAKANDEPSNPEVDDPSKIVGMLGIAFTPNSLRSVVTNESSKSLSPLNGKIGSMQISSGVNNKGPVDQRRSWNKRLNSTSSVHRRFGLGQSRVAREEDYSN